MTDYGVLGNLLVIFSVSIAVVFMFHQFPLPSIAGFLVAGALIGPHGLNLIADIATVQVLAEIGVVLLLFTIGIEFSLVQLASLRRLLFIAGPIQVGTVLAVAWVAAMSVGMTWQQGVFGDFFFAQQYRNRAENVGREGRQRFDSRPYDHRDSDFSGSRSRADDAAHAYLATRPRDR